MPSGLTWSGGNVAPTSSATTPKVWLSSWLEVCPLASVDVVERHEPATVVLAGEDVLGAPVVTDAEGRAAEGVGPAVVALGVGPAAPCGQRREPLAPLLGAEPARHPYEDDEDEETAEEQDRSECHGPDATGAGPRFR